MGEDLESAFQRRMVELCDQAESECPGFRPDCLREAITSEGGRAAAIRLVEADNAPGGFVRLWELGRLDLSVEAEIRRPEWAGLFDEDLRARAAERLERYGFAAHAVS